MCKTKTTRYAPHAQPSQQAQHMQPQFHYGPANQGFSHPSAFGRGCYSRRGYGCHGRGESGFGGAPRLFGFIARRMRNRNGSGIAPGGEKEHRGTVETPTYGMQEPAYHERDVMEAKWENISVEEHDAKVDPTAVEQKTGVIAKNVVEGIGQRRIDEALRSGMRYESTFAPPEYNDTLTKG
ncbi:hypothetical protein SBOR_7008 [Sclerotinia borealis F-4128]|uniref:Uncharacterized protein n=1 Tax=Sclerotinia borealis (strain F-4128) TaxID=1432307 RepID=W9C9R6_SCLBF|nr:hypothetical protein SBOR_7008 [Sclerotinia borealis F-4128]